ncbi:MAG: type IV pilus biogenesis protein PilM [Sedimenticola sp.]
MPLIRDSNTGPGSQFHSEALAENYIIYSSAVLTYAVSDPSYSGSLADNNLDLPPLYSNEGTWNNMITVDGLVWVWGPEKFDILTRINNKLGEFMRVGLNKETYIWNPAKATFIEIQVPNIVPRDNIVMIIKVR